MKQPAVLIVAVGFVVGVAVGSWLSGLGSTGVGIVAGLLALRWLGWKVVVIGLVAAGLGLWRIASSPLSPSPTDLTSHTRVAAEGTGTVLGFPNVADGRQQFVIRLTVGNDAGNALVTTEPYPLFKPGDTVSFKGSLKIPKRFPDFDYQKWLAKDGIHVVAYNPELFITGHRQTLDRVAYPVRAAFLDRLGRLYREPAAGFLAAILIGERSGLPESLQESFRKTGTVHVMALSGYNISILIAAVVAILGRKPSVLWISFLSILGFIVLVGPSPSVVRAALMGSFLLLGQLLGRPQLAIFACIVTAAIMLAYNPWSLRYDLGFDLSFLATLGILLWEAPIRERLSWVPEKIREIVSATASASLPTVPLIALTFGTVSLISPIANIVVVPAIPWLMLGAFVSAVLGLVLMPAAVLIALVVETITRLLLQAVEWMSAVPGASVTLAGSWSLVAAGIGLCICLIAVRMKGRHA